MKQKLQHISYLIEQMRKELSYLLEERETTDPEVLAVSRRLDIVLNYYNRINSR